jgi:hypothetical protein
MNPDLIKKLDSVINTLEGLRNKSDILNSVGPGLNIDVLYPWVTCGEDDDYNEIIKSEGWSTITFRPDFNVPNQEIYVGRIDRSLPIGQCGIDLPQVVDDPLRGAYSRKIMTFAKNPIGGYEIRFPKSVNRSFCTKSNRLFNILTDDQIWNCDSLSDGRIDTPRYLKRGLLYFIWAAKVFLGFPKDTIRMIGGIVMEDLILNITTRSPTDCVRIVPGDTLYVAIWNSNVNTRLPVVRVTINLVEPLSDVEIEYVNSLCNGIK